MLVNKVLQLVLLAAALLCDSRTDAATTAFKLCGRKLGEIMSRVCHAYNSPAWDVPIVVEQPASIVRRKRQAGIADECCTYGCTWEQLGEYCAIIANSEPPSEPESMETHMIADRSIESRAPAPLPAERETRREEAGEKLLENAERAAPVVGTVSPLLTWGRTLNTDLPPLERDRYSYIAVYT